MRALIYEYRYQVDKKEKRAKLRNTLVFFENKYFLRHESQ